MNHLILRSVPYRLLMAATNILEVGTHQDPGGTTHHALWRDRVLPVVSLRRVFGVEGTVAEAVRIVHEQGGQAVIYLADAVLGLAQWEERELLPLPPLFPPCATLFDRACPAPDGDGLLLRCQLPLALPESHDQTAHC